MKVVLPAPLLDEIVPRLTPVVPHVQIVTADESGNVNGDLHDAHVLLRWFFSPETLDRIVRQMPALRWLHIPRAGVDGSLVPAVMERDIMITNSAGVHAAPIAEFVMLFALSHAKQSPRLLAFQAERRWGQREVQLSELAGKTMLIIGLGQIGRAVAVRAAAFGMHVIGSRRSGVPTPGVAQVVGEGAWRDYLGQAHYVVIAAPLTPTTRGMFGAAEFAAMRPDAYLINIARGEVLDEPALIEALRAGRIAGAGLDVFAQEPLPADSPLWGLPNVFATPHISWNSPEIRPRTIALFVENARRYTAGEQLLNLVDKYAGY